MPLDDDGLVDSGFAGGERGIRGWVKVFSAEDGGTHVWTFHTIPGPGEVGHDTGPEDKENPDGLRRAVLGHAGGGNLKPGLIYFGELQSWA